MYIPGDPQGRTYRQKLSEERSNRWGMWVCGPFVILLGVAMTIFNGAVSAFLVGEADFQSGGMNNADTVEFGSWCIFGVGLIVMLLGLWLFAAGFYHGEEAPLKKGE